jgi:hypothetical protein
MTTSTNSKTEQQQLIESVIKTVVLEEARSWSFGRSLASNIDNQAQSAAPNNSDMQLVTMNSKKHLKMLKQTLQHLNALKKAYPQGSATRHVLTQACNRIKRLVSKLENNR